MKKLLTTVWAWITGLKETKSEDEFMPEAKASKTLFPPETIERPEPVQQDIPEKKYAAQPVKGKKKNGEPRFMTAKEVYEQQHGIVMKGMCVYHLDNDRTNFHIDNLGLCTRKELLKMNTSK